MQKASSRIWTRVDLPISSDGIHYTTNAFKPSQTIQDEQYILDTGGEKQRGTH